MAGPLEGLKVIEMAGIGPCPLAGQLLADLGAEVIVVDRAAGEPRENNVNNRNKKSVAINLKSPLGISAVLALIESADVLMEGFRPGVMEKLGLGPDMCHQRNPGLVYGRMTGWGQQGPLSKTAGHDLNYLSLTGTLSMMGHADRPPTPPLNLVADYGGGSMFLIFGILSALWERARSGKGQVVDTAMIDGVAAMASGFHTMIDKGNWVADREANMLDGGAPYYRVYETSDGKYVSLGALEPRFFAEFVAKANVPAALAAKRDDRKSWPEQVLQYAEIFKSKSRREWEAIFALSDGCVAPVLAFEEAPDYPHNARRSSYVEVGGIRQPFPAPRFDRTPAAMPRAATPAGSDTRKVLAQAGLNDAQLDAMEKEKVIFSA